MDVRLNVLEFQDVYTYFLGRVDVNPTKFVIYTSCAQVDDDDYDDNHENHDDGDDGDEDDEDDGNSSIFTITGVP